MAAHTTEQIRNLAFFGHDGAGKTSLVDALMVKAGMLGEMGNLERGTMTTDFDPLERKFQYSLVTGLVTIPYKDITINLLDTPGDPDFRGQALSVLSAVETAVIVINAAAGIEMSTRSMMRRTRQRKLCRMIVINRMDMDDVDLPALIREIREEFGPQCLPINLPAEQFTTVRDCFYRTEGDTDILSVADAHTEILDQVVEVDEELMGKYLEGEEISPEELHQAFGKALRQGNLIPICFTSAQTGAGCEHLLRLAQQLLPNPAEGNPPPFRKGPERERVTPEPDADGNVLAHVFKIANDPYAGKLGIFRVYQGTIRPDTQLFIGDGRKPFKVSHLYRMHGKEHHEVDVAVPGDICAVAKVDEVYYDAILHDSHDEDHYFLKAVDFPQPMFGVAVSAKTRGQEQKLAASLERLSEEDPCFVVEQNQELNETVVRGLGEMHLRVMLERLKTRYGVEVETKPPSIAYRETITRRAEGHHRHKKQTGGAGQFGEVFLRIAPLGRGEGFRFASEVVGGAIPTSLIPAVEKGVRQVMEEGAIAGFPLQDVEVVVYDGKFHAVDSKEIAFVVAGRKAFLDAIANAGPQVLEPIVELEVTVPDTFMGDVTGALAAKRARIQGTDSHSGTTTSIKAAVPLSVLSEFPTELKSLTGGQGRYTMSFSHYEAVPADVQKKLVESSTRSSDEDE